MSAPTSAPTSAITIVASALAFGLAASAFAGGGPAETAQYQVVFDATWSSSTHPMDFPGGAHFSPPIGGTHAEPGLIWAEGDIATTGIEFMAETGSKTFLRNEVLALVAEGSAGNVIEGFSAPSSPGQGSFTFSISQSFPLATIVTMIAPSPDWFVGTDGLPLFVDGHWVPEIVVPLLPYDAGSDSGAFYSSPNQDTQPPEPIFEIFGYPFAEGDQSAVPLGTFTFRRVDAPPCPGDVDSTGDVTFTDLLGLLSSWGPCECAADTDDDGVVGFLDLLTLLAAWGPCG